MLLDLQPMALVDVQVISCAIWGSTHIRESDRTTWHHMHNCLVILIILTISSKTSNVSFLVCASSLTLKGQCSPRGLHCPLRVKG